MEMPRIQVHKIEKDLTQSIIRKQTKWIIMAREVWNRKPFGYLENDKIVTVTCKNCSCFFCQLANNRVVVCILYYTNGYKILSLRKLNCVLIYMPK